MGGELAEHAHLARSAKLIRLNSQTITINFQGAAYDFEAIRVGGAGPDLTGLDFQLETTTFSEIFLKNFRKSKKFNFETSQVLIKESSMDQVLSDKVFKFEGANFVIILVYLKNTRLKKVVSEFYGPFNLVVFELKEVEGAALALYDELCAFPNYTQYLERQIADNGAHMRQLVAQEVARENEWQLKLTEYRRLLIEDLEKEHTKLLALKSDLKKKIEDKAAKQRFMQKTCEQEILNSLEDVTKKLKQLQSQRIDELSKKMMEQEGHVAELAEANAEYARLCEKQKAEIQRVKDDIRRKEAKIQEIKNLTLQLENKKAQLSIQNFPGNENSKYKYFCFNCESRFSSSIVLFCNHIMPICFPCAQSSNKFYKTCIYCRKKVFGVIQTFNMIVI